MSYPSNRRLLTRTLVYAACSALGWPLLLPVSAYAQTSPADLPDGAAKSTRFPEPVDYDNVAQALAAHPLLPLYNVGPQVNADFAGGAHRAGLSMGNSVIADPGDYATSPDAFVGLLQDRLIHDIDQEWRSMSFNVRYFRTLPDEPNLGWDVQGGLTSVTIDPANTQFIRGNIKAATDELHFPTPTSGAYQVLTSHGGEDITEVGAGVRLINWYGHVVDTPYATTKGGEILNGYGLLIQPMSDNNGVTFKNAAAIKLEGRGAAGRILWSGGSALFEDASSNLTLVASKLRIGAHPEFIGRTPSVDPGVTITGDDAIGRIVVGSEPRAAIVVTFTGAPAWTNPPVCFAQDETSDVALRATSVSPAHVTFKASGALNPGDQISYRCEGFQ